MFRPHFCALLLAGLVTAHAAEPHPSLPPPVIPDCLGVNIHFTDPRPGEMEMLAAAGFKWVRMDFGWGGTERKKGEYDFSAYDRLVAKLDQFKIRAVFILDYGNPLYADPGDKQYFTSRAHTTEFREAFGKWAVAAVQHFKGRGYLWEMWNEPNGGFWKSPDKTGDYIALAKSTGEALRQAGLLGPKGEAYIGPATSTIDLPYLEACFKAGLLDYWDAVSVHPYRQVAPETVEEEYRSVRTLIRKYGPKDKVIPIISGEWGYSSAWPGMGKDEAARAEQQGKYLPRQFLTNIANDVALSIWYDWHDDGPDPKEGEHRFGIVGHDYHAGRDPVYDPKPAYNSARTLAEVFNGIRFNKRLDTGNANEVELLFTRDEQIRIAAWINRQPGRSAMDIIFRPDARFEVVSTFGPKARFHVGDVATKHLFGDAPSYVIPLDEADVRSFETIASWPRAPLEFPIHVPTELEVHTGIKNGFLSSLPVDLKAQYVEAHPGGICITGWRPPQPRLNLIQSQAVEESFKFKLSSPVKGQRIRQNLLLWLPGVGLTSFVQTSSIEVSNEMDAELLPLTGSSIPIRILNPSGEAISATASLWNSLKNSVLISLKSGERETVIQFRGVNTAPLKMPAEPTSDSPGVLLQVQPDGSNESFLFPLGAPMSVPDFDAHHLTATGDGDARVPADVSATDGLPDRPPPLVADATALKISYRFEAGWKFCRLAFKDNDLHLLSLRGPLSNGLLPRKFGLWVYGDAKGCQPRIRFSDYTGQTFQSDGPRIDWKGWRYVTFPMRPSWEKPLAHWSGANDGEIHYPMKWDTFFLLDNVSHQPVEGEIYLSAPTLIYKWGLGDEE